MEHTEHQQFSSTGPIPVVSAPGPQPLEPAVAPSPTAGEKKIKKSKAPLAILLAIIILGMILIVVGLLSSRQQQPTGPTTEVPITVSTPTTAPTPTPSSPQIISARTKLNALQTTLSGIDPYDPSLSLPVAQSSLGF